MNAKLYKPLHGGYPGHRPRRVSPFSHVVVNTSPLPPHGFGLGAVHEAYDLGRRAR